MTILQNQVCFRTLHLPNSWQIDTYESMGGYKVWRDIVQNNTPAEEIIAELKLSALRGRGGAGFPTGIKWSFISRAALGPKYIVCNADEGEPGTFKDREILLKNPHQLIEGMFIAGYVMGMDVGYICLRGEFIEPGRRLEQALIEARQAGLFSTNFVIHTFYGAGAYICGEETALMESLEGKKGLPRFKPPFPATYGVYGRPTTINNVETLATVPVILEKGAKWHLDTGKPNNGGYKIFSVSGHVNKPGNYEIPLGTPFAKLLELAGGVKAGKKLKAVIPGGSSAPILPAEIIMQTDLDFDSLAKAGSMLGSGAIIVMDETTNMAKLLARIADFYAEESCGQCSPCREGTGWMARIAHRILQKNASQVDLTSLNKIADNIGGRTICALGDAAAMPVRGILKYYGEELLG